MSLAAIRAGLKARLETIVGLAVYERAPDSLEPPAALIVADSGDYDQTMGSGGYITHRLRVELLVMRGGDLMEAQARLDPYLDRTGASSIYLAIRGDRTLGGACQAARVIGYSDFAVHEYAGQPYIGANFALEVLE